MTVPLTVSFGPGFDASATGVSEADIAAGAQAGWDQWLAHITGSRIASAASFEIEIVNDSTPDFVASISIDSVSTTTLPATITQLQHELLSGIDANGDAPDAVINVGEAFGNPVGGATTVMAHEFGHALGFVHDSGQSIFAHFFDSTDFTGPLAVESYGGLVPVLQDGCNCHIANPAVSIMGGNSTSVASLDAAILTDIGTIGRNAVGTGVGDAVGGSFGPDTMSGASGDDRLIGSYGDDLLYGNQGIDIAYGNLGSDTLFGGQDADVLFGGQQADLLYGNLAADITYGNLGADTLYGGQGADTLYGGQEADVLFGNAGDDILVPGLGSDTIQSSDGADSVVGFDGAGGDRISVSSTDVVVGTSASGATLLEFTGGSITLVGVPTIAFDAGWIV